MTGSASRRVTEPAAGAPPAGHQSRASWPGTLVERGEALLAPSVTRRLIAEFASRKRLAVPAELGRLTPREHEVLLHVAAGLTNGEIARTLCLADQTVKSHVSSVLFKLELRDRVQAVILAYESGLVVAGGAGDGAGPARPAG